MGHPFVDYDAIEADRRSFLDRLGIPACPACSRHVAEGVEHACVDGVNVTFQLPRGHYRGTLRSTPPVPSDARPPGYPGAGGVLFGLLAAVHHLVAGFLDWLVARLGRVIIPDVPDDVVDRHPARAHISPRVLP